MLHIAFSADFSQGGTHEFPFELQPLDAAGAIIRGHTWDVDWMLDDDSAGDLIAAGPAAFVRASAPGTVRGQVIFRGRGGTGDYAEDFQIELRDARPMPADTPQIAGLQVMLPAGR